MVGARFSRIDVVFDNYHELPINIGGRSKRSKGNDILLKLIFSLSEIKQWGMFSSSNEKKRACQVSFAEWKNKIAGSPLVTKASL